MVRRANLPAGKFQARSRRGSGAGSLREPFLAALAQRTTRNPAGRVVIPTGVVDVAEIAQVLRAIDRTRMAGGRHDR